MKSNKNHHDKKEHSVRLKQSLSRNQAPYFEYWEDDDSHTIKIKYPDNKHKSDFDRQHPQSDPRGNEKGPIKS